MTSYLVLRKTPATATIPSKNNVSDGSWAIVDDVEAASATAAVRAHLNGADEGGEFVAVPARSWQPVKVSIEKAIKLG